MMKRLASTAAVLALMTAMPLAAQTTAPETAPAAPTIAAPAAPAATQLPALLDGLALDRLKVETKRDGMRKIEGYLPDGTEIEAEFDMQDNLVKLEADDGVLPADLVARALPPQIRDHPAMQVFATYEEIKVHPRHIEIEGFDAQNREVELKFSPDHQLIEAKLDDAALSQPVIDAILPQAVRGNELLSQFARIERIRPARNGFELRGRDAEGARMRVHLDDAGGVMRFGREGERAGREGRGPRHDRAEGRGPRHDRAEGRGPGGPRGPAMGQFGAPMGQFDTVAANQRLSEAGYSDFGLMMPQGPRIILDATNPDGEAVRLELDPRGQLVRETAR
ncbi:hypothetical protein [Paracoccus aestuarii]|nr:hypothetical protein [Paracoccus aestuarii]WCQ98221.1 hypothetical protein JHW48_09685 [Paracoccus aestuarii]